MGWADALAGGIAGGLAGGAQAVGQIADDQIRQNDQAAAEVRAANLQLDIKTRLAAADQMMKQRAMERFKGYMGGAPAAPGAAPAAADGSAVTGTTPAATAPDSTGTAAPAAGAPAAGAPAAGGKWSDSVQAGLRYAAVNDPAAYAIASQMLEPMLDRDAKQATDARKGTHDDAELQLEKDKAAETSRHNKASEATEATKAAKDPAGSGDKSPADAKMIEYLVKNGMDRQAAIDRVMGTGAGATKDPVALTVQMASSLISSGQVRVSKDDPAGTTLQSKAMSMALAGIQTAQQSFGRGNTVAAPAPAGDVANPTVDTRPAWLQAVTAPAKVPTAPIPNVSAPAGKAPAARPPLSSFIKK